jgi:hypothetical protein
MPRTQNEISLVSHSHISLPPSHLTILRTEDRWGEDPSTAVPTARRTSTIEHHAWRYRHSAPDGCAWSAPCFIPQEEAPHVTHESSIPHPVGTLTELQYGASPGTSVLRYCLGIPHSTDTQFRTVAVM